MGQTNSIDSSIGSSSGNNSKKKGTHSKSKFGGGSRKLSLIKIVKQIMLPIQKKRMTQAN